MMLCIVIIISTSKSLRKPYKLKSNGTSESGWSNIKSDQSADMIIKGQEL